jgi:hypothetical protein
VFDRRPPSTLTSRENVPTAALLTTVDAVGAVGDSGETRRVPSKLRADQGDEFDVLLPIGTRSVPVTVTHVARMRGDQVRFMDALGAFLMEGGAACAPLGMPVAGSSVGELADLLNTLGGATVQSIDEV